MKKIPYGRQYIDIRDKNLVRSSLSKELITTGSFVGKFEREIKKYLKCKYTHVCSSGTAAIHLAMLSIGLKKNQIILMPAINFIAAYNMAKNIGLKIYLVDVDEYTGQITPNKIEECIIKNKIKKIHALLVMFHGGYPENCKKFYDLKKKYNFFIIEDACHALGSQYKYKNKFLKIGSCKHSDISTFSLHPLKTITSGEGGVVTTNSAKISKNINLYRSHGMLKKTSQHWNYDILKTGYNYRLSDINCALGLSQLKKIRTFLINRKKKYQKYMNDFKKFDAIFKFPEYSSNIKPSFHLFLINISFKKIKTNKNHFIKYLMKNNIIAQQHYIPIYRFKVYAEKQKYFPGSEKFFNNTVSLPIYSNLSKNDQIKVIKVVKNYFKNCEKY